MVVANAADIPFKFTITVILLNSVVLIHGAIHSELVSNRQSVHLTTQGRANKSLVRHAMDSVAMKDPANNIHAGILITPGVVISKASRKYFAGKDLQIPVQQV